MTTNNPPIAAWAPSSALAKLASRHNNAPCVLTDGPAEFNDVALVRLSDYERLQADHERLQVEREKLRKDAERYQSLLEAVLREIPHREGRRGNAPGHGHSVPGVWDEDNGALAGKECAWCKVWREALTAMEGCKP